MGRVVIWFADDFRVPYMGMQARGPIAKMRGGNSTHTPPRNMVPPPKPPRAPHIIQSAAGKFYFHLMHIPVNPISPDYFFCYIIEDFS